jgi:hypothetical protein
MAEVYFAYLTYFIMLNLKEHLTMDDIGLSEMGLMATLFAIFVFEVAMVVNVWQSSRTTGKKLAWTALMLALYPLAGIVYFFGFRQNAPSAQAPTP